MKDEAVRICDAKIEGVAFLQDARIYLLPIDEDAAVASPVFQAEGSFGKYDRGALAGKAEVRQ